MPAYKLSPDALKYCLKYYENNAFRLPAGLHAVVY